MDEILDYADKSQPIREHDCTVCMTCQEICPEGATLLNQPTKNGTKKQLEHML